MTYREMLEKIGVAVTNRNLRQLGDWLGSHQGFREGCRAALFPDAEPNVVIKEGMESEWIRRLYEANLAWEGKDDRYYRYYPYYHYYH